MSSFESIRIPTTIPVMALSGTVLFPHAVLPLYIFEERYRQMLADVLEQDRLFAIFNTTGCAGEYEGDVSGNPELATIGTVGIVRAAHRNSDGTSNLALQGIRRVRLVERLADLPYPLIRIEPCGDIGLGSNFLAPIRNILALIKEEPRLAGNLPEEYVEFLGTINDPVTFIDVAAHALCHANCTRQKLLELLSLNERYAALQTYLLDERSRLRLFADLQGRTRDDEIALN